MTFKWNPYPDTRPPKNGRYLVTPRCEDLDIVFDVFNEDTGNWFNHYQKDVLAWAELPQPYEKPVRLKAYPMKTMPSRKQCIFIGFDENELVSDIDYYETYEDAVKEGWTHWAQIPEFDFVEE